MTESEIRKLIRQVVQETIAPILLASVTKNENSLRTNFKYFASAGEIPDVRNIQPFGVSSRAPVGTNALVVPIDGNQTHLVIVGNHDADKPTTDDGETILYDAYGHVVYLSQTKMQFGSKTSSENMVLGKVFKQFADNLLTALQAETHLGNLGFPTSPPVNAATYAALQTSPIQDDAILSDKAFTEK